MPTWPGTTGLTAGPVWLPGPGDNRERSDIDLAVYGMPEAQRGAFWLDAEELPTLLKLDIVHVSPDTAPEFLRNIKKDGVTLYAAKG